MSRGILAPARWLAPAALVLSSAGVAQEIRVGGEFQVNSYTPAAQVGSAVALDAEGDFVVAWNSSGQDHSDYGIFARRFSSDGVALANEFQVHSFTTGFQSSPSVAASTSGDFVVAWDSNPQDGSSFGVFARRFSSAGVALANELQVNSYTTSSQSVPSVAMDADGDFVVTWHSAGEDGSAFGIFARLVSSAGPALATEFQVNSYTTGYQLFPAVAAAASGDFVIAWQSHSQDGSNQGIFARRFSSAGGALATEFQVHSYTTDLQTSPSVAAAADGDFVIVWQSEYQDGSYWGVFARRFSSAGVALAAEFQVNIYTSDYQTSPSVAADADGDFVVTWQSFGQDGAYIGVFARRFSSAGDGIATEFQVNSQTINYQLLPSVAADAAGDFVVAWQSFGQDGADYGVFAQRFAGAKILDIDGNGLIAPLTDGLLVLRYLFGFTGATLVTGAVDLDGCTRCTAPAIEAYLAGL